MDFAIQGGAEIDARNNVLNIGCHVSSAPPCTLILSYAPRHFECPSPDVQGGSNMTGTDLCINKPHCAAAVRP